MILNSKVRNTHNLNLSHLRFPRFCKMQGLKNAGISVCRDKNAGIENAGIRKWRDWEMQGWKCRDWHPRDKTPGMTSISRMFLTHFPWHLIRQRFLLLYLRVIEYEPSCIKSSKLAKWLRVDCWLLKNCEVDMTYWKQVNQKRCYWLIDVLKHNFFNFYRNKLWNYDS